MGVYFCVVKIKNELNDNEKEKVCLKGELSKELWLAMICCNT